MGVDAPGFFAGLRELATLAVDESQTEETAESVVQVALRTIGCDYAGLTIFGRGGSLRSMAPSDPVVEKADRLQHELREGPCVAAAEDCSTYVSQDLGRDPRWPTWGPLAADLGLGSLLATRLVVGERVLGALNLYDAGEREFTTEDRDMAEVFAVHAATALIAVQEREHLRAGMNARTLIGQAQGILMERFDIDADHAFAVLRRYSQAQNLKLRAVAEDVVRHRVLPTA